MLCRLNIFLKILICIWVSIKFVSTENDKEFVDNSDIFWRRLTLAEVQQKQSDYMQYLINPFVDPCDDFFEYACGNWLHFYTSPDSRYPFGIKDYLKLKFFATCKNFTYSLSDYNFDVNKVPEVLESEEKLNVYYSSCLQEYHVGRTNFKKFVNGLETYGTSPLWDPNWKSENFDMIKFIPLLKKIKLDMFFIALIQENINNPHDIIINLFTHSNYIHDPQYSDFEYEVFIRRILNFAGIDNKIGQEAARDIVQFEMELTNLYNEQLNEVSESLWRIPLDNLITKYPGINWRKYFAFLMNISETSVDLTTIVVLHKSVEKTIDLITRTKPETIANFLIWSIIFHKLELFDNRYRHELGTFMQSIDYWNPNWNERFDTRCANDIDSMFSPILGTSFVNKYFHESNENELHKMFNLVRENFEPNDKNWYENYVSRDTLFELAQLKSEIGRPQPSSLKDFDYIYNDLKISRYQYIENWFNAIKFDNEHLENNYVKNNWKDFHSKNYEFNIQHDSRTFSIPIAHLQPPNFHRYFPHALNFGGIVSFIIPELVKKISLNKKGGYLPSKRLNDSLNCFGQQIHIWEEFFALEKLLEIYEKLLKNNPNEKLAGFNVAPKKLLFLNYAQNRCTFRNFQSTPDIRAFSRILANSDDFSEAFGCKVGTRMNPQNKCKIRFK